MSVQNGISLRPTALAGARMCDTWMAASVAIGGFSDVAYYY